MPGRGVAVESAAASASTAARCSSVSDLGHRARRSCTSRSPGLARSDRCRPARRGRAPAACVPGAVPAGTRRVTGSSSVGTVTVVPEGRLGEGDRHGQGEVPPAPAEQRVPGRPAPPRRGRRPGAMPWPARAAALHPDALAVLDARRDPHLHLPVPPLGPRCRGRWGTGCPPRVPRPLQRRADGAQREQPLVVVERAPARRSGRRCALDVPGRRPAPLQVWQRASSGTLTVVVTPRTASLEDEVQLGLDVGPPLGTPGPATAAVRPPPNSPPKRSPRSPDVLDAERAAGPARTAGPTARPAEPAGHRAEAADLVVLLALGGVAQHVVGRRDLLEPVLRPGVGVGVVLLGQLR